MRTSHFDRVSRKKLSQVHVDKALDQHAVWLENRTSLFGLVRAGKRADFSYCDLRGVDFSDRDLRQVIFHGALVTGAVFDGAILDSKVVFRAPHGAPMQRAFSTSVIPRPETTDPEATATKSVPESALHSLHLANAVAPRPTAPVAEPPPIDYEWNCFVEERTPAQPQRWTPSLPGQPFTWYPSAFPRPSAPPLEHGLEL